MKPCIVPGAHRVLYNGKVMSSRGAHVARCTVPEGSGRDGEPCASPVTSASLNPCECEAG